MDAKAQVDELYKKTRRVYNQRHYAKNKDKIIEKQTIYNLAHKREIEIKRKIRRAKEMECYWCHKHWNTPGHIVRYKRHLFCDEDCLGEYLVSRAEDDIEIEWFDTPENIEICEREKWAEE